MCGSVVKQAFTFDVLANNVLYPGCEAGALQKHLLVLRKPRRRSTQQPKRISKQPSKDLCEHNPSALHSIDTV